MALVLRINPRNPQLNRIRVAAKAIREGGLVAFPTETIYGLGANALNGKACSRIFKVKGRRRDNPLIVHVDSIAMAEGIGVIPERYKEAVSKVWPGPISFVVKARKKLPKIVTAGLSTVAIRMPSNKIARLLIRESGVPIAAPSVNRSTRPSATNARHIENAISKKIDVIIDSGSSEFGLESTILDLRNFTLLRPGAFTIEQIKKAFHKSPKIPRFVTNGKEVKIAITPGMKYRHYSPSTPLFLFEGKIGDLKSIIKELGIEEFTFIGSESSCKALRGYSKNRISLGGHNDPYELARNLFDRLIILDRLKARFAIIESFDEKNIGFALMNRIRKATGRNVFSTSKELEALLVSYHQYPK